MDNPMSVCENTMSRYVSHWDLKDIVRKPPFEDVDVDTTIHDPIYLVDYEHVFYLVMESLCAYTYIYIYKLIYMYIHFKINLYLSIFIYM